MEAIRWDRRRPRPGDVSINHAAGQPESGLSVTLIAGDSYAGLRDAVGEYGAMYRYYGARCWLVEGDHVGTGSDGEPLLAPETVRTRREIAGYELDRLLAASLRRTITRMASRAWQRNHPGPPRRVSEWRKAIRTERTRYAR